MIDSIKYISIFCWSTFAVFALPGLFVLRFELQLTSVLHAARRLPSRRIHRHLPFHSLRTELSERIFYIDIVFSARFEENHVSVLLAEFLAVERADFALLLQVDLVPNHQKGECVRVLRL